MTRLQIPCVTTRCVAHQYASAGERIVEFTFPSGKGGLISFRDNIITVYRQDPGVFVQAGDYTLATTEEESGFGGHKVSRLPVARVVMPTTHQGAGVRQER